jgi:hypothetical protein
LFAAADGDGNYRRHSFNIGESHQKRNASGVKNCRRATCCCCLLAGAAVSEGAASSAACPARYWLWDKLCLNNAAGDVVMASERTFSGKESSLICRPGYWRLGSLCQNSETGDVELGRASSLARSKERSLTLNEELSHENDWHCSLATSFGHPNGNVACGRAGADIAALANVRASSIREHVWEPDMGKVLRCGIAAAALGLLASVTHWRSASLPVLT